MEKCEIAYVNSPVCGTDGVTYGNIWALWCAQKKEYGKSINLQLKHEEACWFWQRINFELYAILGFWVSKLPTDLISIKDYLIPS